MRAVVRSAIGALMLASVPWSSRADQAVTLLRCHAQDAVNLSSNGTLERDGRAASAKNYARDFTVDLLSGMIRPMLSLASINGAEQWIVVQQGEPGGNATVLVLDVSPAKAVSNFLQVQAIWRFS